MSCTGCSFEHCVGEIAPPDFIGEGVQQCKRDKKTLVLGFFVKSVGRFNRQGDRGTMSHKAHWVTARSHSKHNSSSFSFHSLLLGNQMCSWFDLLNMAGSCITEMRQVCSVLILWLFVFCLFVVVFGGGWGWVGGSFNFSVKQNQEHFVLRMWLSVELIDTVLQHFPCARWKSGECQADLISNLWVVLYLGQVGSTGT